MPQPLKTIRNAETRPPAEPGLRVRSVTRHTAPPIEPLYTAAQITRYARSLHPSTSEDSAARIAAALLRNVPELAYDGTDPVTNRRLYLPDRAAVLYAAYIFFSIFTDSEIADLADRRALPTLWRAYARAHGLRYVPSRTRRTVTQIEKDQRERLRAEERERLGARVAEIFRESAESG